MTPTLTGLGPVVVAAGCGGTGRELAPYTDLAGLDLVTRTLTLDPDRSAEAARVVETTGGVLRTSTSANPGVEHFLSSELPGLVRAGVRVHVSVAATTPGEFAALARRLAHAPGVAGLEVDLGEPDAALLGWAAGTEPFEVSGVVGAVRREFGPDRPVCVKLAALHPDLAGAARAAREAGATAVVVGHLLPASTADGTPAGLGGAALRPVVLRAVRDLVRQVAPFPVMACGGVDGVAAARTYLEAGAAAVQVGSALLADPSLIETLRAQVAAPDDPARPHGAVQPTGEPQ